MAKNKVSLQVNYEHTKHIKALRNKIINTAAYNGNSRSSSSDDDDDDYNNNNNNNNNNRQAPEIYRPKRRDNKYVT